MSGTIYLQNNVIYRARIFVKAPSIVVGAETVLTELSEAGWNDLQVWLNPAELPSNWPADRKDDPSHAWTTCIWCEGRWDGSSGDWPDHGDLWAVYDIWIHSLNLPGGLPPDPGKQPKGGSVLPGDKPPQGEGIGGPLALAALIALGFFLLRRKG